MNDQTISEQLREDRAVLQRAEQLATERYPELPNDYTGLLRIAVQGDRRAFIAGYLARDYELTEEPQP